MGRENTVSPPDTLCLLADVHANLEALQVVLDDLPDSGDARIICLGDIVGYGPNPSECLELLRERDALILAGNHDAAACGEMSTEYFNRLAKEAAHWTRDQLTEEQREFLRNRPHEHHAHGMAFFHGSPRKPLTEYVTSEPMAADTLDAIDEPKLAVGHTHQPVYFRKDRATTRSHPVRGDETLENVAPEAPMVVNPGSVGQPRDGDPRASYLTIDLHRDGRKDLNWRRREYPIAAVQEKIRNEGLPEPLASRLGRGQ